MSLRMNERAWKLADQLAADAMGFRVATQSLPGGARVIDAGVTVSAALFAIVSCAVSPPASATCTTVLPAADGAVNAPVDASTTPAPDSTENV